MMSTALRLEDLPVSSEQGFPIATSSGINEEQAYLDALIKASSIRRAVSGTFTHELQFYRKASNGGNE